METAHLSPLVRYAIAAVCMASLLGAQVVASPALRPTRLQPRPGASSTAQDVEQTKEAANFRLQELGAILNDLKARGAHRAKKNDPLRGEYLAALKEYQEISASLGGDQAVPMADGDSEPARTPEIAPPAPPSCTSASATFTNSTPVAISTTGTPLVSSTIVVTTANTYLYDLDVQTFITHTFNSDLDITLTSPAGTIVTLSTDNGSSFDNVFNGTIWDDDADPNGVAPFTATAETIGTNPNSAPDHPYANNVVATPLAPEEALGAFIGENPNGTWTITVSDDTGGDGGSLIWNLTVTTLTSTPNTLAASGSNSTPVAISRAGNPTITSTIAISTPGTSILDVNVTANITHTFSQDLQITLTSPGGTVVTLASNPFNEVSGIGNLDNVYAGTTWDDDGDPDGQVPYASNPGLTTDHPYVNLTVVPLLAPTEGLAAFIGENPTGTWTMTIGDRFNGDGGALNSWSLNILSGTCAAVASADISTTKVDTPDPVNAGSTLTYTVTATNNGPNTPTTMTITDTLPASTTFVSATGGTPTVADPPVGTAGGTVTHSFPGVASGNSVVLTIVVSVPAATVSGTVITNTATSSSDISDPNGANNSGSASTTVQTSADLAVTKTDSPDPVVAGANITYTITLTNNGPSNAQTVSLSDTVPTGTTFVSFAAPAGWSSTTPAVGGTGTVTSSRATQSAGSAPSFTLVVKANCSLANGSTITNTASVTTATTDPNSANNSSTATTMTTNPAPTITCPANITTVGTSPTGATVTYSTPVASDSCAGATVVCTPPSGSVFNNGTTTVTCTATDSAGSTSQCTFTVTVTRPVFNFCMRDDVTGDFLRAVTTAGPSRGYYEFVIVGTSSPSDDIIYFGVAETVGISSLQVTLKDQDTSVQKLTATWSYSGIGRATLNVVPTQQRFVIADANWTNSTCN